MQGRNQVYKPSTTREKLFQAYILRFFISQFLTFVALASALLGSGCTTLPILEKPSLELAGLRIDKMSLHDPELGLILRAHNPNGVSIPLKSVSVAVELNDREFAQGESTMPVTLPAHGTALVEMTVHAHTDVMWTAIKDMMHSPGGNLRYRLRGSGVVGGLDLHFNFDSPGTIDFDTLLGHKRSNP